jgi:hypothetical protein
VRVAVLPGDGIVAALGWERAAPSPPRKRGPDVETADERR